MGDLNSTPMSGRLMIAMFGKRNAGKSSLINALTGQKAALVSDVAGTTTDPVYKSMELLPIGPVVFVDTAGLDDVGELGALRVEKTKEVLHKTHLAILVINAEEGVTEFERKFAEEIKVRKVPCICAVNKCDLSPKTEKEILKIGEELKMPVTAVSAGSDGGPEIQGESSGKMEELKALIIRHAKYDMEERSLVEGLISKGQTALLVTPIDSAAPKGRLILPQQQTIRDILDKDAHAVVVKEGGLKEVLESFKKPPTVVITDSQAFADVSKETPDEIPMTSFSILFARQKGDLNKLLQGVRAVSELKDGDKVLIMEACTHHRQSDDIGTVKIPRMLKKKFGEGIEFEWASGAGFPKNIGQYKVIIHCGACMVNRREMQYRLARAEELGVPMTNYGMVIASVLGILGRALKPFKISL